MRNRTFRYATAALFVLGAVVVGIWARFVGGPDLVAGVARLHPLYGLLLAGATGACVLLRFIRWQYLLRRLGIRIPTRRSLSIYLASLAGIATPAYLGESIRSALIRRAFGVPVRVTLPAWIAERLLDFAALALITGAAATGSWLALGGLLLIAGLLVVSGGPAPEALMPHSGVAARLSSMRVLPGALGLSIAAWLPATLLVTLAAAGLDIEIPVVEGMRTFGAATVGGGISLMPAGMGATGSLAILQLDRLGVGLAEAVVIVSIVRLATAGITLAVGGVFLLVEVRALRAKSADVHFDDIADEYIDQFAPHIWDLLLERKTTLIASALPPAPGAGTGLDLGCGLGRQCHALRERGFRVWGIDAAHNLVRQASATGVTAVTGSALELPYETGSLDFVYTVGVLHHLPGPAAQATAYAEVARVLKPGGTFIIHETNPRNPLFRLYMGYVFPMLRSIDEGIEHWIDPAHLNGIEGLERVRVEYFTFLPDFLPRPLLGIALGLEQWLERSRMRRYSVHYMAVLRKDIPDRQDPVRHSGALDAARA